jgi:hypothetical protein
MRRLNVPLILLCTAVVALLAWPATADAQRRGRARGRQAVRTVVFVGGYNYPVYAYGRYYQRYGPYYQRYGPYGPYGHGFRGDARSSLRIDVDPSDAEVFVDGYFAGYVDDFDNIFQRLHLAPGGHEIVVYLDGYRSLVYEMYLGPYSDQTIRDLMVPLGPEELPDPRPEPAVYEPSAEPPPADQPPERQRRRAPDRQAVVETNRFGSLAIVVQPVDATVTIDGEPWTVADGETRLLVRLTEGRHHIEIHKEGYARYTEDVLIREARTLTLNVSLVRSGGR